MAGMTRLLLLLPVLFLLAACQTTDPYVEQQKQYRRLEIAAEAPGDYYIGRRFHVPNTHFWGYVRRPGESWEQSRLVVLNERLMRQPDRLPEMPAGDGPEHGIGGRVRQGRPRAPSRARPGHSPDRRRHRELHEFASDLGLDAS